MLTQEERDRIFEEEQLRRDARRKLAEPPAFQSANLLKMLGLAALLVVVFALTGIPGACVYLFVLWLHGRLK